MSDLIDNRKHRQAILKGIIRDIHVGTAIEETKARFGELLGLADKVLKRCSSRTPCRCSYMRRKADLP